jgi:DNA-directed RNA polymerase beta subunit
MIVVYSNIKEYDQAIRDGKPVEFKQWIMYKPEHAEQLRTGQIKIEFLITSGVCEYISPEEMDNCLVSPDVADLIKHQNNVVQQYSHCGIPQALLGLAALVSPYANHTQAVRVALATTHARHACGTYCHSWPFRADTQRFLQVHQEMPLVRTLAASYVQPNGLNCIVAYIPGDNQEDSMIVRKGFIDRGGFVGYMFRVEHIRLEKDEFFGNPNSHRVRNTQPNASYSKLDGTYAPVGTVLKKGDVYIGRVSRNNRGKARNADEEYVDRSVVYKNNYSAVVDAVWSGRSEEDGSQFITVKLRYWRHLKVGEKFSTRSGNKGILARVMADADMPYTDEGIIPDIIFNPHGLPSRMSNGQIIETAVGMVNVVKGIISDGTPFRPVDTHAIGDELVKAGLRRNGTSRMYSGMTGKAFDASIFTGPCFMQEIQKFISDIAYAVGSHGSKNPLTRQLNQGKAVEGGLRTGEMETWTLDGQGSVRSLEAKIRGDADGCDGFYCQTCKQLAIYNEKMHIYKCKLCGDMADIVRVPSRHTAIVVQHEFAAVGVHMDMHIRPPLFDEDSTEAHTVASP